MRKVYRVLVEEDPEKIERRLNAATAEGYELLRFSFATGAGIFYAIMEKVE